jgi:hypothetical protein
MSKDDIKIQNCMRKYEVRIKKMILSSIPNLTEILKLTIDNFKEYISDDNKLIIKLKSKYKYYVLDFVIETIIENLKKEYQEKQDEKELKNFKTHDVEYIRKDEIKIQNSMEKYGPRIKKIIMTHFPDLTALSKLTAVNFKEYVSGDNELMMRLRNGCAGYILNFVIESVIENLKKEYEEKQVNEIKKLIHLLDEKTKESKYFKNDIMLKDIKNSVSKLTDTFKESNLMD